MVMILLYGHNKGCKLSLLSHQSKKSWFEGELQQNTQGSAFNLPKLPWVSSLQQLSNILISAPMKSLVWDYISRTENFLEIEKEILEITFQKTTFLGLCKQSTHFASRWHLENGAVFWKCQENIFLLYVTPKKNPLEWSCDILMFVYFRPFHPPLRINLIRTWPEWLFYPRKDSSCFNLPSVEINNRMWLILSSYFTESI